MYMLQDSSGDKRRVNATLLRRFIDSQRELFGLRGDSTNLQCSCLF
jgi:hypothetical protein